MAVQIGDNVILRFPDDARKTVNSTFEITVLPDQLPNGPTWWEMVGDVDGLTYVFTMLVVFTVVP